MLAGITIESLSENYYTCATSEKNVYVILRTYYFFTCKAFFCINMYKYSCNIIKNGGNIFFLR